MAKSMKTGGFYLPCGGCGKSIVFVVLITKKNQIKTSQLNYNKHYSIFRRCQTVGN